MKTVKAWAIVRTSNGVIPKWRRKDFAFGLTFDRRQAERTRLSSESIVRVEIREVKKKRGG